MEVMGSVTLQCGGSITANPTPSVQWTNSSGSPVSNGSRFTITGDLGTVLEISNNTMSDEGNWTCEVTNSIGSTSVVFLLTVLSKILVSCMESCFCFFCVFVVGLFAFFLFLSEYCSAHNKCPDNTIRTPHYILIGNQY